ncbi:hypothetical protein BJ912DRAFT_1111137 [Pholiota molesta]|nr:hypothetical protein BJ912DRAFT_1111137 [Pholiota molesta]
MAIGFGQTVWTFYYVPTTRIRGMRAGHATADDENWPKLKLNHEVFIRLRKVVSLLATYGPRREPEGLGNVHKGLACISGVITAIEESISEYPIKVVGVLGSASPPERLPLPLRMSDRPTRRMLPGDAIISSNNAARLSPKRCKTYDSSGKREADGLYWPSCVYHILATGTVHYLQSGGAEETMKGQICRNGLKSLSFWFQRVEVPRISPTTLYMRLQNVQRNST